MDKINDTILQVKVNFKSSTFHEISSAERRTHPSVGTDLQSTCQTASIAFPPLSAADPTGYRDLPFLSEDPSIS